MAVNPFDQLDKAFGQQEGLCEAGVFALTPEGWTIISRKKFTQMGTATRWAEAELKRLSPLHEYTRYRTSVLADVDPQRLDDVCAEYEAKRLAGDPQYVDNVPPELRQHMKNIAETGPCEAVVCARISARGSAHYEIMYRKSFENGVDAHQWARYYEQKLNRRSDVEAFGTVFCPTPSTDEEILQEFREGLEEGRRGNGN